MIADKQPWLRCRCVYRYRDPGPDGPTESWPNDFIDRCPHQATAEDGLCDHCRQPNGQCTHCGPNWPHCCRRTDQHRHLVDLTEPCWDRNATPAEVPF